MTDTILSNIISGIEGPFISRCAPFVIGCLNTNSRIKGTIYFGVAGNYEIIVSQA